MNIFLKFFLLVSSVYSATFGVFDCLTNDRWEHQLFPFLNLGSMITLRSTCRFGTVGHSPNVRLSQFFGRPELLTMPLDAVVFKAMNLPRRSVTLNAIFEFLLGYEPSDPNDCSMFYEWLSANMGLIENDIPLFVPSTTFSRINLRRHRINVALNVGNHALTLRLIRLADTPADIFHNANIKDLNFLQATANEPDVEIILQKYFKFRNSAVFMASGLSAEVLTRFISSIPVESLQHSVIFGFVEAERVQADAAEIAAIFERNTQVFNEFGQNQEIFSVSVLLKLINIIRFGSEKYQQLMNYFNAHTAHIRFERCNNDRFDFTLIQSAAILEDEPEIMRFLKNANFWIPSVNVKTPKPRCFSVLSDEELEDFLNFSMPLYRDCLTEGMDESDAFKISQLGKQTNKLSGLSDWGNVFLAHEISVDEGYYGTFLLRNLGSALFKNDTMTVEFVLEVLDEFENDGLTNYIGERVTISLGLMKKILDHPDPNTIPRIFSSFNQVKAPYSKLLNSDRYSQVILANCGLLFSKSGIYGFEEILEDLDYPNIRRGFQFIGAPVTGCGIGENFNPNSIGLEFADNLNYQSFRKVSDVLPSVALSAARNTPRFNYPSLSWKLNEHWLHENPRSMLGCAPYEALRHYKQRFAAEDIEAVRVRLVAAASNNHIYLDSLANYNQIFSEDTIVN